MTLKLTRITHTSLITDKPASAFFQRIWAATMLKLEETINGNASLGDDVAALKSGVAFRDADNEFTGQNTFDEPPDSPLGYMVQAQQVVGPRATGWTAGTGTPNEAAFVSYAGQPMGAGYSQAAVQALDDATKAASQRLLAIEQALRTHGLIDG